jgi:molybdopterin converting factor small subunit
LGLCRLDNFADTYADTANGVPSDVGFALLIHPRNPDRVYIVPVESNEFRFARDGRVRVNRSRNSGVSWDPLMRALPQKIATEQGQVREHINIFIGDENVRYTGGLASPVSPGSEISIAPAVSSG